MTTCPGCGTQAFDQTTICSRCGRPLPKKSSIVGTVFIILAVCFIPAVGIMAVLGIYGVRKYIANAKTAEARGVLGQIGRNAVVAYEADGKNRICPSATLPVPANESYVSGKKYQSTRSDWMVDAAANAGFACLELQLEAPQYFQYSYAATSTGFVARARGDLNGNGLFSTFELRGQVVGDRLVVAPSIAETDPEE